MSTEVAIYRETATSLNSETGEVLQRDTVTGTRKKKEKLEPYVKVYKYLNTVFAFYEIPLRLTPYLFEFAIYMGMPEDEQLIKFDKHLKSIICKKMGVSEVSLNRIIGECVKYDLLIKTEYRGVYHVNPYILTQGDTVKTEELKAKFDYMTGRVEVGSIQKNLITGQTVKQAIIDYGKGRKQIEGQTTFDEIMEDKKL